MNKQETETDKNNQIQNRFERLRLVSGLTQEELAERFKVTVRTWRNWEKGQTVPIGRTLDLVVELEESKELSFSQACAKLREGLGVSKRAMARLLGVDVNTWLYWENAKHKPNTEARKKLEEFVENLRAKGELNSSLEDLFFKRQMAA